MGNVEKFVLACIVFIAGWSPVQNITMCCGRGPPKCV
jgi:hypothetical protein